MLTDAATDDKIRCAGGDYQVFETYENAMDFVSLNNDMFGNKRFHRRSPKTLNTQEKREVLDPSALYYKCNPQGRMRVRSYEDVTDNVPLKNGLFPCYKNLGMENEELVWVIQWECKSAASPVVAGSPSGASAADTPVTPAAPATPVA